MKILHVIFSKSFYLIRAAVLKFYAIGAAVLEKCKEKDVFNESRMCELIVEQQSLLCSGGRAANSAALTLLHRYQIQSIIDFLVDLIFAAKAIISKHVHRNGSC